MQMSFLRLRPPCVVVPLLLPCGWSVLRREAHRRLWERHWLLWERHWLFWECHWLLWELPSLPLERHWLPWLPWE